MAVQHITVEKPDTTIHETPGVMGGYPCIGNTRISVRALVEVARLYGAETIAEYYPHLTRAQIDAGLAYYAAHPARVDEDIARNRRADAEYALPGTTR